MLLRHNFIFVSSGCINEKLPVAETFRNQIQNKVNLNTKAEHYLFKTTPSSCKNLTCSVILTEIHI